jgi:hypothetical protein
MTCEGQTDIEEHGPMSTAPSIFFQKFLVFSGQNSLIQAPRKIRRRRGSRPGKKNIKKNLV